MSSKKAKAARKLQNNIVTGYESFGVVLPGVKHVGKQVFVAFGLYNSASIQASYVENSVEYNFESLKEMPVLVGTVSDLDALVNREGSAVGLSLGIVLITDKSKLITDDAGFVHLEAETFPFRVGDARGWRNPKLGHLLDDDEATEAINVREAAGSSYRSLFPEFDDIFKVEQIIDQAGMSNSLDALVDKVLLGLLTR